MDRLKLYDIVRPSREYIEQHICKEMIYIPGVFDLYKLEKLMNEALEEGHDVYSRAVGYIDIVSDNTYAVKWLTRTQCPYIPILPEAWWLEKNLEKIGNALQICKDLI